MAVRICVVLLCAVASVGNVYGQVASLCRPNERFLSCGGCQRTCLDPAPDCAGQCRVGCYCDGDEVRNATGHCVKLAECPSIPSYKLDTSEPRPADASCPDGEEYRFCEPCSRTCGNPRPVCPAQCARGCFCRGDLVRDKDGRCVELEQCSNRKLHENDQPSSGPAPYPYKKSCRSGEVYKECENCEQRCDNPNPHCPAQCARGCFCQDGLVRAPGGLCVLIADCPAS